jgi:hypothetical protein
MEQAARAFSSPAAGRCPGPLIATHFPAAWHSLDASAGNEQGR